MRKLSSTIQGFFAGLPCGFVAGFLVGFASGFGLFASSLVRLAMPRKRSKPTTKAVGFPTDRTHGTRETATNRSLTFDEFIRGRRHETRNSTTRETQDITQDETQEQTHRESSSYISRDQEKNTPPPTPSPLPPELERVDHVAAKLAKLRRLLSTERRDLPVALWCALDIEEDVRIVVHWLGSMVRIEREKKKAATGGKDQEYREDGSDVADRFVRARLEQIDKLNRGLGLS